MAKEEMAKPESLRVLKNFEKVFSVAVGMREAVQTAMSAERNATAIKKENDEALKVLMADKEKVKEVKVEIGKVAGDLETRLQESNKIHKALKIKLKAEREDLEEDNDKTKKAGERISKEMKSAHGKLKSKHTTEVNSWEKKIIEMERLYEEAKGKTLAEVKKK